MTPYCFPLSFFIFLLQFTAFASSSSSTHILQDVLKAVSAKQKWDFFQRQRRQRESNQVGCRKG
ncbi:hypothetical protein GLYMA_14G079267v4 [Glycine max]|nr:hypothetical protein GLYMA_14G079267v4 [Glycine max]KAH1093578.1 hypothetical protein GYH30_039355 [Glycine max]